MKNYETKELRNICVVGSQGSGKTSIAEALLFDSGVINRLGKVEEGNTVCDNTPEEIDRKISINLGTAYYEHKNNKINLLVTPGYPDFAGEIHSGLAVADTAVFVVDADSGINPVAENIWEYLDEINIPAVIYVNKLDKENLDFEETIKEIKEKLSNDIAIINIPDSTGQSIKSVINILDDYPSDTHSSKKEALIETVSSADDVLTEKYLEGKEITPEELKSSLIKAIKERKLFPVLCGSATKNIGIKELSDFIVDFTAHPRIDDKNDNFSAIIYKTQNEPGTGSLNFAKIYSGKVNTGKDIYNFTRQTRERIGQLSFIQGKKKIDALNVSPGDLVAFVKLKDTRVNDLLGEEKSPPNIQQIKFPDTIYDRAIITTSKGEAEKVGTALSVMTLENPTIMHHYNSETKQMIVSGLGAQQLEIMIQKLKSRYNVSVELHPPRVPYKETIHGKSESQGKYKKQSGGRGQYGDCWIKIEPNERGKGFEFIDKIVGGAIPRNYIPSVEKGIKEAMDQGIIAGYQVVDVKVTLFDGSYHEVDSSDMAFKIAGAMAIRKAFNEAKPCILEPIMNIEIILPDGYLGAIMGDLNSRRGRVLGTDKSGKKQIIKAQVPLGEIFQYATDLRSLTKGSGKFSITISHYEDCPAHIAQTLIEQHQKSKELESVK